MKMTAKRNNIPSHPAVWWSRNKTRWPVLVWIIAIAAAVLLYRKGIEQPLITGILEVHEEIIAPVEDGVLQAIFADESDAVTNGQPLARMDTTMIDQEIKAEEALGLQEAGAVERYQEDAMRLRRQYSSDIDTVETSLLDQKRAAAEAKGELDVLVAESARLQGLVDQRLADAGVLAKLGDMKARIAALSESMKLYPQSIENLERQLASMKTQLEELNAWMDLEPVEKGPGQSRRVDLMKMQTQKYHEEARNLLMLRRERCTFYAKSDGTVSRIFIRPGSTVTVGIPIMTVVHAPGKRVVAFVPEGQAVHNIEAGMNAHIIRQARGSREYDAVVEGLGPEIYTRTIQAGIREQFIRGRRLALTLAEDHDLIPGETVSIALQTRSMFSILKSGTSDTPNTPGETHGQSK